REKLDDAAAIWRLDDVSDEGFLAQVFDVHFALLGERMLQRNDEREFVLQYFGRLQLWLAWDERNRANVETIVEHFVGNVARKHPVHANLDAGGSRAECGQRGQQRVNRTFVDS